MNVTKRLAGPVAGALALGLALSSCAISDDQGTGTDLAGGSIKSDLLKGDSFTVGSKDFDEQLLLGQITLVALKAAGASTTDKTNIQGTSNTRAALVKGDIDMYWDYTGTGWITFLKNTKPIPDSQKQYEAVKKEDLAKNKIAWLDPAPANNTYAIAAKQPTIDKYKTKTLSDYAALAKKDPQAASICVESEFKSRDDGFPGVEKTYGFTLPDNQEKLLDTAVVYTTLNKGGTCNFGEVFETDGRVSGLNLVLLKDDKSFFPIYNPALTMQEATAEKYPELADLFKPIAAKLTTEELSSLNKKVSVDGEKPNAVATEWLKSNGFIG
ncbi:MAG: glycine betaine ABC transporter substrate-binding protein [Humibacillus sp.]|nr:glycine betaine ABC transporter substrate-binding protein [Humibacillus sp.]MDN5778618.1 glycine betaine ABC transporter substrate-binding protein [Humibacillus sp.]